MGRWKKIFLWLIMGIILSFGTSSMIVTRDGNLMRFYDDGYVEDLKERWHGVVAAVGGYDVPEGKCSWETEGEPYYMFCFQLPEEANYLVIDTRQEPDVEGVWEIYYRDKTGVELAKESVSFTNDKIILPIQEIEFEYMVIGVNGTTSFQYVVEEICITEFTDSVEALTMLPWAAVFLTIYGIITVVWLKIKRNRTTSRLQESTSGMFIQLADEILNRLHVRQSSMSYAPKVRIFLLICIAITWKIVHYNYGYTYAVAMNLVLFLALVAWIPIKEETKCVENRHPIMKAWVVLLAVQFLSDVLLKKEFEYSEFISVWMLLCFGLLYRAWKRMPEPHRLLEEFARAVEILFFMNVLYCFLGDARKGYWEGALTGIRTNPNPFAMGVALSMVILAFRLYQAIRQKKKWFCYLEPCIGILLGIWMLKEADSRNGWTIFLILLLVAVMCCFGGIFSRLSHGMGLFLKVVAGMMVVALIIGGIYILQSRMTVSNVPTTIYSLDSLLSGRLTIWKEYLGRVGLLGNTQLLYFNGTSLSPHNGIVTMAYRYGAFAGVAFLMFLLEVTDAVWHMWKKNMKNEYMFLVVGILVAYLFPSMLDTCDEGIMGWMNWFAFYFIIGFVLQEKMGNMENDRE